MMILTWNDDENEEKMMINMKKQVFEIATVCPSMNLTSLIIRIVFSGILRSYIYKAKEIDVVIIQLFVLIRPSVSEH